MPEIESKTREFLKGTERAVEHVAAIVIGLLLMIAGVGMGVTMVMLPVGIGVGFLGVLAFAWGLFGDRK